MVSFGTKSLITTLCCALLVFALSLGQLNEYQNTLQKRDTDNVQIFEFNIKNDADPSKLEAGEEPWTVRKEGVLNAIRSRTSQYDTLIGLQEVIRHQLTDILDGLGDGWTYYGIPRGDGGDDNEMNPILYNSNQFNLDNNVTYWLSDTPTEASKSWGAKYNRIVTVTSFTHKSSNRQFDYLNTHFDFASEDARTHSANEIIDITNNKLNNSDAVFFSGDLNAQDTEPAYGVITNEYTDSNKATTQKREFEIDYSAVIDYIFFKKNSDNNLNLVTYEVINGTYHNYSISDHAPSYAVFEL